MIPFRRLVSVALLLAVAAVAVASLGSCSKNDLTGQGLDRTIIPIGAGPQGNLQTSDSLWKYPVNSIDSVIFTDDIDSTTLEVTSFQLFDSLNRAVPGTVRFMPGNAYIHYNQDFPSNSYDFFVSNPPLGKTLAKVYFIPAQPLHGDRTYHYQLTTGLRTASGRFRRDVRTWSFATGDSVAPPDPIWP